MVQVWAAILVLNICLQPKKTSLNKKVCFQAKFTKTALTAKRAGFFIWFLVLVRWKINCFASPEIIRVKVCNRWTDGQTDKFFWHYIRGYVYFFFQLNLLPPYSQGDKFIKFQRIKSTFRAKMSINLILGERLWSPEPWLVITSVKYSTQLWQLTDSVGNTNRHLKSLWMPKMYVAYKTFNRCFCRNPNREVQWGLNTEHIRIPDGWWDKIFKCCSIFGW